MDLNGQPPQKRYSTSALTSSLASDLHRDHLTCRICQGVYRHPKALPCLHTFCTECLREYIFSRSYDDLGEFPCPICRRDVRIPGEGVERFPDNHLIANLLDTVRRQSGGELSPLCVKGMNGAAIGRRSDGGVMYNATDCLQPSDDPHFVVNGNITYRRRGLGVAMALNYDSGEAVDENRCPTCPTDTADTTSYVTCTDKLSGPTPQADPRSRLSGPGAGCVTQSGATVPGARPGRLYPELDMEPLKEPRRASTDESRRKAPARPPRPSLPPRSQAPRASMATRSVSASELGGPTNVLQRVVNLPSGDAGVPVITNRHGAELCIGKYGTDVADFVRPVGLAASPEGYIIVSDEQDNRVLVFGINGQIRTLFTCQGAAHCIHCTKDGRLYVANSQAAQSLVVCYNLKGHTIGKFGNFFTFEKPHGIAATSSNHLVVSSTESHLIYVINEEGKMVRKFSGKGKDGKRLRYPYHVAVNSKDNVIVSDHGNDCVKVFDSTGKCKYQIGTSGRQTGQLQGPRGVCVDRRDNIVVADSGNHRVQIFDRRGNFLAVAMVMKRDDLGNGGTPVNVLVTRDDRLVVLLAGAQFAQVRVYRYSADKAQVTLSSPRFV